MFTTSMARVLRVESRRGRSTLVSTRTVIPFIIPFAMQRLPETIPGVNGFLSALEAGLRKMSYDAF